MNCCDISIQIIIAIKRNNNLTSTFFCFAQLFLKVEKVQRGIEPRSIDSKSNVLTTTLLDQ